MLADVAGENAKKIRVDGAVTLERLRQRGTAPRGSVDGTGRAGSFESGRVNPTLPTLLKVAAALSAVTGRRVTLLDLFEGTGRVAVDDDLTMTMSALRAALSGGRVALMPAAQLAASEAAEADYLSWRPDLQHVDLALRQRVLADFTETDRRLAKELGAGDAEGAAAMAKRWGKTFVAQRDELAGPGANPQRKGQISRQLKAELQKAITE